MIENNHNNEGFSYTYSAKEQEELKRIRQRYIPKETDKMEQLLKLDEIATQKGMIASLVVGIIGTFLLGIGMCCAMVWMGDLFIPGIIIGVIGIVGVSAAYPLCNHVTKKEREKIAPEIIRLTDELLKWNR